MSYRSDCELLGLDPSHFYHDPQLIKERFRELALKLHPDIEGGDRDRFEAVREAYERLYGEAEREFARCPDCKGVGRITSTIGFSVYTQSCAMCCGTGKRQT